MSIVFLGSPEFAVAILRALVEAGADVRGVVTQPDKPAGRGNELRAPAVKRYAEEQGLDVLQPRKVRDGSLAEWIRSKDADLAIVAAYGRILGPDVLQAPRRGCVNVHASLLPRWRGASPITRAIAACDAQSGVCLMQMDEGLDTGPELARAVVPIADDDTTATLEGKLSKSGADLTVRHLPDLLAGRLHAVPQPVEGVTHAPPLDKHDGRIDWHQPAEKVHAHVRAMFPWPCAWTEAIALGEVWKIFPDRLRIGDHRGPAGMLAAVDAERVWVCCATGSIGLTQLQRPGKRQMAAVDVLRGVRFGVGSQLGS